MWYVLSSILQFFRHNLFLLILIIIALTCAPLIQDKWQEIQRIEDDIPALERARQDVLQRLPMLGAATTQHMAQLSQAPVSLLDTRIRALDGQIEALHAQARTGSPTDVFQGSEALAARLREHVMREIRIELLMQSRSHLQLLRAHTEVMINYRSARERLNRLRQVHRDAYSDYQRRQAELVQLRKSEGLLGGIPGTPGNREIKRLEQLVARLVHANNQAHQQFETHKTLLDRLPQSGPLPAFRIDEQRITAITVLLDRSLLRAKETAARSVAWRIYQAVYPVLPTAFGVLAAWWVVPWIMRTFFYYVLAPLAARRPPVVIDKTTVRDRRAPPSNEPPSVDDPRMSAVSRRLILPPGHELIIRPDFCQSQAEGLDVSTRLLFSWRLWLTSIAAHLWMLKRVRTDRQVGIVVSSSTDPLDEVALLEIGAGEAFVLQPRSLVGMAFRQQQPPAIRSHWRIGSLHAWLTFQLRYLAFEGPATLVVKGCRGVRLEHAGEGRQISQWATLGFSTGACYSTTRAEPFWPYLKGTQPLFNDKFVGQHAWYLYEEVPGNARTNQRRRNPLDMLVDAGLKAFGI